MRIKVLLPAKPPFDIVFFCRIAVWGARPTPFMANRDATLTFHMTTSNMGNYGVIIPFHISTRVDSISCSSDSRKFACRAHGLEMFRSSAVENRDSLLRTMVLDGCTTD